MTASTAAWLAAALVAAVLAALPAAVDEWLVAELALFFTYGLLAMSLAFVWGHCGMLCLGQAVFFGIGAYAMSVTTLGMLPGTRSLVSTWAGLALAMLASAGFANLLGRFAFSGQGLRGAFFGIVSLAVAFIVERLAINWDYLGGLNGLMNVPPLNLGLNGGGRELWQPLPVYYVALAAASVGYVALEALIRSPYGTALAAIRDNEPRTRSLGYDTGAYKVTALTVGAAVAGLAGALFVTQFGFASPTLIGFELSAEALIWVAIGGRRLLLAAFMGAVLVRGAESAGYETLGEYWPLALGALFIASVMWLPRGLVGEPLARVLERGREPDEGARPT